jgi:hypothetical protein
MNAGAAQHIPSDTSLTIGLASGSVFLSVDQCCNAVVNLWSDKFQSSRMGKWLETASMLSMSFVTFLHLWRFTFLNVFDTGSKTSTDPMNLSLPGHSRTSRLGAVSISCSILQSPLSRPRDQSGVWVHVSYYTSLFDVMGTWARPVKKSWGEYDSWRHILCCINSVAAMFKSDRMVKSSMHVNLLEKMFLVPSIEW